MKETPLSKVHEKLGAQMVEFAGYFMPVRYGGINEEHQQVRNNVGVFDVSHMGEFLISGPNALDLIQWVTSNDASRLVDGQAQYSCFPNENGGIIDDLIVYRMDAEHYMLVVNASNMDKDWNWIQSQNKWGAAMHNASDEMALLAVQGPNATKLLQPLTDVDLSDIKFYHFAQGKFAGIENVLISATGYTGAGGFELYIPNGNTEHVWNKIFEDPNNIGVKPIGLGARDTLRMEMGYCLYGNDIDDNTGPIAAGLSWITKLGKEDFVGKHIIQQVKESGPARKLTGFKMVDRGIPRKDYPIVDEQGNEIGVVTSGTQSPSLGEAIGLGYIDAELAKTGSEVYISVRDKKLKASVMRPPFINQD